MNKKITPKKLLLTVISVMALNYMAVSQNVGINANGATPADCSMLDIVSTTKGLLIPRVALTNVTTYLPLTGTAVDGMIVYSTANPTGGSGTGYYYWSTVATAHWVNLIDNLSPGNPWIVGGNTETGAIGTAYILGHNGNHHIDFYTNGSVRGRISNLGEFFIGTTATAMPGDLMNGVSNASFPWAVNGYSNFDGGGVYGGVQSGSTVYGGVQGEYNGTNAVGSGVRGVLLNTTSGTDFLNSTSGVMGDGTGAGNYRFGVNGSGGTSIRSGGVIGNDYGTATGALGYFFSNGINDYAVYGFGLGHTTGVAGGLIDHSNEYDNYAGISNGLFARKTDINTLNWSNQGLNTMIGLGIYGGVMGGWIKGLVYGVNLSGERYGVYVHGKTITNNLIVTLNDVNKESRVPTYSSQSMKVEISDKGKSTLKNGISVVKFNSSFSDLVSEREDIIITITPIGKSKGLYIEKISNTEFIVKENDNGNSNLQFNWIAIGVKKGFESPEISEEILDKSFEDYMNGTEGVMYNDNNPNPPKYAVWWDGSKVKFNIPSESLFERKIENKIYRGYNKKQ